MLHYSKQEIVLIRFLRLWKWLHVVTIVCNWFKKIRADNFTLKDKDRNGRRVATNLDHIKTINSYCSMCEIIDTIKNTVMLVYNKGWYEKAPRS